ncbi:hypothetical protein AB1Y20_004514 [Prymnesium parvum]|uniref:F-box domain-containing protein n=1 Tax=Prymnesium parvum TaxID=97485 RepID=A0AB34IYA4_PRYPA
MWLCIGLIDNCFHFMARARLSHFFRRSATTRHSCAPPEQTQCPSQAETAAQSFSPRKTDATPQIIEQTLLSPDVLLSILEHLCLNAVCVGAQVCCVWRDVVELLRARRGILKREQTYVEGAVACVGQLPCSAIARSDRASLILPLESEKISLKRMGTHFSWDVLHLLGWECDAAHLYIIDSCSHNRVAKYCRESGELLTFSNVNLRYPMGLVLVQRGDEQLLYVSDMLHHRIIVLNTMLQLVRVLECPQPRLGSVYGLTHHAGVLYAADCLHNAVYALDLDGQFLRSFGPFCHPRGVAVAGPCSAHDGLLLVAERMLLRVLSLDGRLLQVIHIPDADLWGVAFDGVLAYVADRNHALHTFQVRNPNVKVPT